MGKSTLGLSLLLLLFSVAWVSDEKPRVIGAIPGDFSFITTDNLGNLYTISNKNVIDKYDKNGKKLSTVNIKINGQPSWVDVSNPLQIQVFYRDLNQVVLLDNILTQRGEWKLSLSGQGLSSASCRSFDNGLWVFDTEAAELKRLDQRLEIQARSGNILMITEQTFQPQWLVEDQQKVYATDTAIGTFVFDVFGAYLKTLHIRPKGPVQVNGQELSYLQGKYLHRYNLQTLRSDSLLLPDTVSLRGLRIEKERLYLHQQNGVTLYAY